MHGPINITFFKTCLYFHQTGNYLLNNHHYYHQHHHHHHHHHINVPCISLYQTSAQRRVPLMELVHIFIQFFRHSAAAAHQIRSRYISTTSFPTHYSLPILPFGEIDCLIFIVDKWNIITQIFVPQFVIIFALLAFIFINKIVIKNIMQQSCSLSLVGFKAMCLIWVNPTFTLKNSVFFSRECLYFLWF